MSSLLVTSGYHVGRRFKLGRLMTIGRAPENDIVLPDNLVSRHHVQIRQDTGTWVVSDVGSMNGFLINDRELKLWRLKRGDRLTLGETTLVFDAPEEIRTARFTNTLIHLIPDQDETMRVAESPTAPAGAPDEAARLILRLGRIFDSASEELPNQLKRILRDLMELMGATAGSLLLRGREGEIFPLSAITRGDDLRINRDAMELVLNDGKAILSASFFAPKGGKSARLARKAIIVPLSERDRPYGAIHLERPEGSDYALNDVSFLHAVSRLVSVAVRQAMRIDQLGGQQYVPRTRLIGGSSAMRQVNQLLDQVAATDSTVLITGETGTGKELAARAVHERGGRSAGPFSAINCAAIPENLIESELFGYERGAFTGADAMKRGRIDLAHGGTLFLDEIGELDVRLQPKLLRFLQERIYYRVGGERPIPADVRIVAASNRDLEAEIASGGFREDLFHRLNVVTIRMPALRERPEDVRPLIENHAPELAARMGRTWLGVEDRAWIALEKHAWPGNVRQLLQCLERALVMNEDGLLRLEHFQLPGAAETTRPVPESVPPETVPRETGSPATPPRSLAAIEREAILDTLRRTDFNQIQAAKILDIHRNTLRRKIEQYGIALPGQTEHPAGS